MKHVVRSLGLLGCLLSIAPLASAQQFSGNYSTATGGNVSGYLPSRNKVDNVGAQDGQFVFALERVTGLFIDRQKLTYTDGEEGSDFEHTYKATNVNLLGVDAASPSELPRFALDYVITRGVSVGGSIMFVHRSLSLDASGGLDPAFAPASTRPEGSTFLAGARVGYAYAFDDTFAVWPRAGVSYAQTTAEFEVAGDDGTTTSFDTTSRYTNLNLELLGVISPVEHIALLIGPYLDLGLGGKYIVETDGAETDRRDGNLTSFGLLVHAAGYY